MPCYEIDGLTPVVDPSAFVHPSAGFIAILFIAVWAYLLYLRKNLIERMKRGLLTTQHM